MHLSYVPFHMKRWIRYCLGLFILFLILHYIPRNNFETTHNLSKSSDFLSIHQRNHHIHNGDLNIRSSRRNIRSHSKQNLNFTNVETVKLGLPSKKQTGDNETITMVDQIFFSVKTTTAFHQTRMPYILDTWISLVQDQVKELTFFLFKKKLKSIQLQ